MTPHEWIVSQRRREQRRDAGWAVVGIVCVLGLLIAAGLLAGACLEGRL